MNRVVCYLITGSAAYLAMLAASIKTLRKYNQSIPIRVLFVRGWKDHRKVSFECDSGIVEIVYVDPTPESIRNDYFLLNRSHLSLCKENSVLYLDADTFFFDDVEKLFAKDSDLTGIEAPYVTSSPDWSDKDLNDSYDLMSGIRVPVFNGGIQLWNNGLCRDWAESMEGYCRDLMDRKYPLSNWIHGNNRHGYYRETFSINLFASRHKLSYEIYRPDEVSGFFQEADWQRFLDRSCVAFHCFRQNWRMCSSLAGLKKNNPGVL